MLMIEVIQSTLSKNYTCALNPNKPVSLSVMKRINKGFNIFHYFM